MKFGLIPKVVIESILSINDHVSYNHSIPHCITQGCIRDPLLISLYIFCRARK